MIALNLYLELLSVGLILLLILFFNNIFLYKRKLKDRISLLLIFGISMSLFDILWSVCGMLSDPGLSWLYYTSVIGYSSAFMIFASILNLYLMMSGSKVPCDEIACALCTEIRRNERARSHGYLCKGHNAASGM